MALDQLATLDEIESDYYSIEQLTSRTVSAEEKEAALKGLYQMTVGIYKLIYDLGYQFVNLDKASLELLRPSRYKEFVFLQTVEECEPELSQQNEAHLDLLGKAIYRLGRIYALNAQFLLMSDRQKNDDKREFAVTSEQRFRELKIAENSIYLSNLMFIFLINCQPLAFDKKDFTIQLAHNYRRLPFTLITQRKQTHIYDIHSISQDYERMILDANLRSLELFIQSYITTNYDSKTKESIEISHSFTLSAIEYSTNEYGEDSQLVQDAITRLAACYEKCPWLKAN